MRERVHHSRRPVAALIAGVTVVAILAASCASGRAASSEDGSAGAQADTTSVGSSVMFGDMKSPCGPGDAAANAAASVSQGVDGSTVTIGYGDDAGYKESPGLNHEMSDAVKAMIDWCNGQGGINGRTVVGNYYDAKITEANNVMTEACRQVFMLVGQGFALDNSSEQTRVTCGLPSVAGYATNPEVTTGPMMFQPAPTPPDIYNIQMAYAFANAFPEKVKHAASVYAEIPTIVAAVSRTAASFPQAGWNFVDCDQAYPLSAPSWLPIVQRLKDCGVEVVFFAGSPAPNFENLLDAAQQADYHPVWASARNSYEETFAAWNQNGNADDVYIQTQVVPFENADSNAAVRDYLDIVKGHGGEVSLLGSLSTSAFLLWARAAQQCGADLSRDCVVKNVEATTSWDAGGLQAPANVGKNIPSECALVLRMQGTKFESWAPAEGSSEVFDCDPKYLVTVSTPEVANAKLDENRRSTRYTGG
jgi:ABC-type branched-subunit amino acid transport system substrate-binding protein